ncbi:MAG: hypothetical protein K0S70_156 [Microbacterium sp.]|nr:hypothetical protein [Microbacterium sp.]
MKKKQTARDLVGKHGILFKIPSASIATYRLDGAVKRDLPVEHVNLFLTIVKPEVREKKFAMDVKPGTRVVVVES